MRATLVNRDFDRLWAGQAISTIGDAVFDITLMIWIAQDLLAGNRWAPAAASGLMICAFLAVMVVGPAAGVFVDRWSRRRTMLGSEVFRGLLVAALWLLALLPRDSLPVGVWLAVIFVVVFAVNSAGQFFGPARFATIGEIVPGDSDRAKAFGISQATNATAAIIGPPLAAPLLVTFGLQWALLVNALSYAVSYLAVRSVRFPADPIAETPPRTSTWRADFGAGLRMFAGNRFLLKLLVIFIVAELGAGSITALNIFFLTDNLHAAPNLLGVLSMVLGAGAVTGALTAGRFVKFLGARTVTWLGMMLGGIGFGVYARQTDLVAALVIAFLFMIPVAAFNAGLSPLLLSATPKGFTGRVIAVIGPAATAASLLSVVISGWLASTKLNGFSHTIAGIHFGRIDLIFTCSAILIATAGLVASVTLPRRAATGPAPATPAEPEPVAVGLNPLAPAEELAPHLNADRDALHP